MVGTKRASDGDGGASAKRARKSLTLEVKMEVVKRYERGESTSCIRTAMGLSESTCRTIRGNSAKIKASVQAGAPLTASRSSYARSTVMERMEKMLAVWIQAKNKKHSNISFEQMQNKARSLYERLKSEEEGEVKPFNASSGWFANFRARQGFHGRCVAGEQASADHAAASAYPATFRRIVEEGGMNPGRSLISTRRDCIGRRCQTVRTFLLWRSLHLALRQLRIESL